MIRNMRRLHARGAASQGICIDVEGAMLGPDCVLVRRILHGYSAMGRSEAAVLQKCVLGDIRDSDWLFRQCQHVADALDKGEIVLAQIYGLQIPADGLDGTLLRRISLNKANFNPDEPRLPKSEPHGGEWTTGSIQDQGQEVADVPLDRNKDDCIRYCYGAVSMLRDRGGDPYWACLRACQGKFPSPFFPEFDSHFNQE